MDIAFALLNLAMSNHMVHEPYKNYLRLTCLTQHSVTLFSLLRLIPALTKNYPRSLDEIHTLLSILMAKISILFLGLLLLVLIVQKKQSDGTSSTNPINKKPMTFIRVARNIYSHYGTTFILWYLPKLQSFGNNDGSRFSVIHPGRILFHIDMGLFVWIALVCNRFNHIYDISEDTPTWKVVAPLILLNFIADGILIAIL